MYRHPFANPELLYGYECRAGSLDYHVDRRSPTPGPYAMQSFVPMASQSSFFGDHTGFSPPNIAARAALDRERAASLPETRERNSRFANGMTSMWTEGINDGQSEQTRMRNAWKRALRRLRRRARRGLQKVRSLFSHRDDKRFVSGFS